MSEQKNSTLDINPIRPILTSDLYFCKNCNQGWKDNKWMECCKGCVGHRSMGWTIEHMKACYGTAMDSLIQLKKEPSYYFPMVNRELPPRRLRFDPARCVIPKYIFQPYAHYELNWRLQQDELLKEYRNFPNKLTWNCIDPEVQHSVLFKKATFRY